VPDSAGNDERGDTRPDHSGDTALRRQQLFVGTAIASLSGVAVVVAGLQQFPGVTPVLPFGVGMVTTAATFAVVYASLFGG
jgi:hypothetical protein